MSVETDRTGSPAARPPAEIVMADARQTLGPAQLDDLFPEGVEYRRSLRTFVILLALASLIAAFGLYQDSVASIIGAMVVAPLGGAIMALAAALVTGRTRWQTITFLEVALGALMVVGIAFVVSYVFPDPLTLTPAMEARTSPGLLDLGVAMAAGAAGAYVAGRRTGTDALPGVAIAVSLVPPLATVGICLQLQRWDDAGGALLLFLTNFAAILVVACVVFVLFGAAPSRAMLRERHRLRNGLIVAIIALVIVTIPLAWNSAAQVASVVKTRTGVPILRAWIGDRELEVSDWEVAGATVRFTVAGPEEPSDVADLAAQLAAAFDGPVDVRMTYVPVVRVSATAAP